MFNYLVFLISNFFSLRAVLDLALSYRAPELSLMACSRQQQSGISHTLLSVL